MSIEHDAKLKDFIIIYSIDFIENILIRKCFLNIIEL